MTSSSTNRGTGRWAGRMFGLFFLPFLILGVFLLNLTAMKVVHHIRAQSWQPVQATLIERWTDFEETESGREKRLGASRLEGVFAYEWQGQRYQSNQLSFSGAMTRSSGTSADDLDVRLDALVGEPGNTFTAWVNPLAPGEAVALRDLRWLEIGAMLGVGLPLTWLGATLLFGGDRQRATAAFSWHRVGLTWAVGLMLAVLCPLLWRDGHPVWAVVVALPLLLAMVGTARGLQLARA